ncbi:TetR/AcrR family transcriptional regulator [Sedimentitalea sp. JM2-8]|uniref:TetR/AcrR family transcriptional regulator n=1 Tax=Sedimentitalea xiamensis TaxID=3050037 RepID=A0ABT7FKF6_9RHOB|nr:TetR/AcrR family transcriptional regulator [Sedimentitalea xiamensis]MDK3075632.1 TetR/AcrR family transcriptional regulator [Sedimentitalea xiamensis]
MPRGIARNHDEKRAALRKGAARYFAKNGYDRASMTGAARQCGVSKALIYHYYGSKEALLFDILQTHLSDLVDMVDAARPDGLSGLIRAILAAYADADAEHKLQLDALSTLPPEMQMPLIDLQRQLVTIMSGAVSGENPALSGNRLRAVTMSIFGILNWFYMWHRPGKGLSRSEYAALAADFVRNGLSGLDA